MAMLCWARILVALVPFRRWQAGLGLADERPAAKADAQPIANAIEWAAERLPFETKCLPRAMALSWLLQSRRIGHSVVIAVRPFAQRERIDALHAWVEVGDSKIMGFLPGPWIETLRLPEKRYSVATTGKVKH
jgi:hypothetical protein